MRFNLLLILFTVFISSCSKQDNYTVWDASKKYTIEGTLIYRPSNTPISNRHIALSQKKRTYSHNDLSTFTDSNGHFKFEYSPEPNCQGLSVYPVYNDYSCIYSEISFVTDIEPAENVDLKNILIH